MHSSDWMQLCAALVDNRMWILRLEILTKLVNMSPQLFLTRSQQRIRGFRHTWESIYWNLYQDLSLVMWDVNIFTLEEVSNIAWSLISESVLTEKNGWEVVILHLRWLRESVVAVANLDTSC